MGLQPGPGKIFLRPDKRHIIRESGIALPKMAQDDPDHGEVLAVGAGAWLGSHDEGPDLTYDTRKQGWRPVRREAPCKVGDVVFYDCTKVMVTPVGWSDEKIYVLEQREVLGVMEESDV